MNIKHIPVKKYLEIINKIPICHRIPERTFQIRGHYFPVCARCTGIIIGYCSFPLFFLGLIRMPLMFIILLNIPILIDGLTQYLGWRESNNKIRLLTGILSSFAICGLIVIVTNIIKFYIH